MTHVNARLFALTIDKSPRPGYYGPGVSRGTVQRLLAAARKKLVDALVAGKAVSIETETRKED